jgi:[ribosomal protein S5]-alanine N-acetyltransferase
MNIFAETERLILRELVPSDADGMFELDSDPEVHRYLGNKPLTDKKQAAEVIEFVRQQYITNGIGRWAVIEKRTGEFLGWSGLKLVTEETNGHINYYDLGYRLIRRHWGKGIATESGRAALQYAFQSLQAKEVFAMADCENHSSNHVLQKLKFQLIETFHDEDVPHYWYKINTVLI